MSPGEAVALGLFQWLTIVAEVTPCGVTDMRGHLRECCLRFAQAAVRRARGPAGGGEEQGDALGEELETLIAEGLAAELEMGERDPGWRHAAEELLGAGALSWLDVKLRRWSSQPAVRSFIEGFASCVAIEGMVQERCAADTSAVTFRASVQLAKASRSLDESVGAVTIFCDPSNAAVWGDRKWLRRAFTSFASSPTVRTTFGRRAARLRVSVEVLDAAVGLDDAHGGSVPTELAKGTPPHESDPWLPQRSRWRKSAQPVAGADKPLTWEVRAADAPCHSAGEAHRTVTFCGPIGLPALP